MVLDDVADDDRVENRLEVLDRRGALEPEVLQSGEAAQDQVVVEQFPGRAGGPGVKFDELAEGQGEYGELHVPAGEVGGQFSGEHGGVGAGEVEVAVPVHAQGVDRILPPGDALDLVEEDVGPLRAVRQARAQVLQERGRIAQCETGLGFQVEAHHGGAREAFGDPLGDHVEQGGLAAPAHAGEDLDDGDVDEGSDAVDVAGTIDVVLHGAPPEVLGDERSGYRLSTAVDRTDRESLTVDCSRQARG